MCIYIYTNIYMAYKGGGAGIDMKEFIGFFDPSTSLNVDSLQQMHTAAIKKNVRHAIITRGRDWGIYAHTKERARVRTHTHTHIHTHSQTLISRCSRPPM